MDTETREGSGVEGVNAPQTFTTSTHIPLDRSESPITQQPRPKNTFAHRRKHSPNLEWRHAWNKNTWDQGRVLVIDYISAAHTDSSRLKIVAQEFCDIDSLRSYCTYTDGSFAQAAFRVIHVQNAPWATRFLFRKFHIETTDDIVGKGFSRWARYTQPQQRGGKPILNGRSFRTSRDPWRGISRTAFGADYLKHYARETNIPFPGSSAGKSIMELNHYDETDQPRYGFDVYVQRLSVYVQFSDGIAGEAEDPDVPNPYDEEAWDEYQRLKMGYGGVDPDICRDRYIPKLRSLDNGNCIILFENSVTGSVKDTLIGARQELESRWRRLAFHLQAEDMDNDEGLAAQCMDMILQDVFKALAYNWRKFLAVCEMHVGILEDKIYENPADESRAPELWKNSAQWLKIERLIYIHVDVIGEMVSHLNDLFGPDSEHQSWLGGVPDELDKLTGQWDRDIIAPTTALSDLMYKSVGIRDARLGVVLGLSMWRLSWITFIFLPLTFTTGFFGMNVATFAVNPSIKYWFIVSAPVLFAVLILWYALKHSVASQRQNPMRRGVYEALYHELATTHSSLWTRAGPRQDVVTVGWWAGLKWRLLTSWFGSEKLRLTQGVAGEELGSWARIKRALARRWLGDLSVMPLPSSSSSSQKTSSSSGQRFGLEPLDKEFGAVGELLSIATPVAIAELDPRAATRLLKRVPRSRRFRSLSPKRSASHGHADGHGGVMVEEQGPDPLVDGGGDGDAGERRPRERERETRMGGPR
ncbi:hypothetical protein BDW02DRAFT_529930 [Decorospora gaudefroyi]|uniref:Cora-domain-containing protein n=1 Tax=Decorospora gaudefroyi TaxID=184978 RepID=A0A6A5K5H9_9PLEO|nr:hypothetical protein BDW02DRAFT_529930 [Decorospora gaudefroyi]